MFPVSSSGVITATHEPQFGLEGLYQKRVVMIPDLPKHFARIVNQSDFQSMCSGESISVARKNKTAISELNWTVPLVFAGNYLPDYNDNSGSISRRLTVFAFDELVKSRNTKLKVEITENELVPIMIRCIAAYRKTVAENPSGDFWSTVAPSALREVQNEVKTETNPLTNFLVNGDDYYQVLFMQGSVTTLRELENAFCNHMRIHHKQDKAKLGTDYHPIKAAGFTVEKIHLCKNCNEPCTKQNCGDHYNAANRYKKVVVQNMLIKHIQR
jgi:hypothetical protein